MTSVPAAVWSALPADVKERVHLAQLPMADPEENAAIVNALQRRSDVVVQKSLAEGFGLTVAEAMWKARPVVASRLGGIRDQIVDGESGILIDDPTDLTAFAHAVRRYWRIRLARPASARPRGSASGSGFLGMRHLIQYLNLLDQLVNHPASARPRA